MTRILDLADHIYEAEQMLARPRPRPVGPIGLVELAAFLSGEATAPAEAEVTRALFARPALRADFRALRARLAMAEVPLLAAASTGGATERAFPGGHFLFLPEEGTMLVYVVIRLDGTADGGTRDDGAGDDGAGGGMGGGMIPAGAVNLVMTGRDGAVLLRRLPALDASGEAMVTLDTRDAADAAFLAIMSDPASEGALISTAP